MIIHNGKEISGQSIDTLPIGTIQSYIGTTPPNGYELCDGRQLLITRYPTLYQLCTDKFNNGNTPSDGMFYLPDLRGKVIAGMDSTQTEFISIGTLFGEKKHKLTVSEMPSHSHGLIYSIVTYGQDGTTQVPTEAGNTKTGYYFYAKSEGGNQEHNNIQPTLTLNYIVKADMLLPTFATLSQNLISNSQSEVPSVYALNQALGIESVKTGTLLNNFSNFMDLHPADTSNYQKFGYYKDRGRCYLKGLITLSGTTPSDPTIFQLPEEYRPSGTVSLTINGYIPSVGIISPTLRVYKNGNIIIYRGDITDTSWFCLDGISFLII